jgi:uncharacterized protein (TIGR02270 family)
MPREYTRPVPITGILLEHIDEAAFLYRCLAGLNSDPDRSWEMSRDYERRLKPHLHALALGGLTSAEILKEKLTLDENGDPGESFVAAAVSPMLDLVGPMESVFEAVVQKPPYLDAIIDGLKWTEGKIDDWLESMLGHQDPAVRAAGAEVAGYRGVSTMGKSLGICCDDPDPAVSLAAMQAQFRLGKMPPKDRVIRVLSLGHPSLFPRAVELLLLMGDKSAASICRATLGGEPDPATSGRLCLYLAISGTGDDSRIITAMMQKCPELERECLVALGFCGTADSFEVLLQRLGEKPESFETACQGLRMLSGMEYRPQFDPDEAMPEDISCFRKVWLDWWAQNRDAFNDSDKWRRGERISPGALYKDLLWRGHPSRNLAWLETIVRYKCPVPVQSDRSFEVQSRYLRHLGKWVESEGARFKPGAAYFHGVLLG